jgi:peptidase M28-like protein
MNWRPVRARAGLAATLIAVVTLSAATGGGIGSINRDDLKEWLSYIASDELQGRALYSTGLGLAAGYIENHLKLWGATPAGNNGASFLQTVRIQGVKATGRSTVTIEVGGQRQTFVDGAGVTFPKNVGVKRQVIVDRVEFAGYGVDVPSASHMDFAGKDVRGAAVIWLGQRGPREINSSTSRNLLGSRNRYATDHLQAAAVIGPERPGPVQADRGAPAAAAARGNQIPAADFTTSQRLDLPIAPAVAASDDFFEMLFSRAPVKYDQLRRLADAQDSLPSFRLQGVKLTFNLDADYEVVRTQLTDNVVAIVEGSDPVLKKTYVAFGAHYDHVGYAEGEMVDVAGRLRRSGPLPGFVKPGAEDDRIWNGADDDGSGTVAMMALARAFAEGPRPKRSLLFVWHSGEERGRYGSLYFADYPTVPIENLVAQLNIDMVGRNRDDKPSESDTVYLVGSDRISSELDAVSRAANSALAKPLTFNYELNDPHDPEQLYFRSDHYSYAAKGIPVIFFTTALHPDYHMNTDEVSKIEFDKLARVTQLVFETGWRLANLDHAPVRDNKGARAQ